MSLPKPFLDKMELLLKDQYQDFLVSYQKPKKSGLRANQLKITPEELNEKLPFLQQKVPWSSDGFYYDDENQRPAKYPFYYAGLYYIQEPSAMLPAETLEVRPNQMVLDLCAAPGGKSIQLASKLGDKGLLVVNDINQQRARVLLKNLERYGVRNIVVLNETPENIGLKFAGFFDKILVDAPCSGEGMFRKDPSMIKTWSEEEVAKYTTWQRDILEFVPQMLKPGGQIVYSTCTFSPEENELQMEGFTSRFQQFSTKSIRRLWPHEVEGEGHFVASILETSKPDSSSGSEDMENVIKLSKASMDSLKDFSKNIWDDENIVFQSLPKGGEVIERSGHILWESNCLPVLKGLKVLRSGLLLGIVDKGRFKPSQALVMSLSRDICKRATQILNFDSTSQDGLQQSIRYLKGETIQFEGVKWPKGWHLITIDFYPLGWAKSSGLWLKNEYPPGWRWIDGE